MDSKTYEANGLSVRVQASFVFKNPKKSILSAHTVVIGENIFLNEVMVYQGKDNKLAVTFPRISHRAPLTPRPEEGKPRFPAYYGITGQLWDTVCEAVLDAHERREDEMVARGIKLSPPPVST